jgi:replicative DNA helicase
MGLLDAADGAIKRGEHVGPGLEEMPPEQKPPARRRSRLLADGVQAAMLELDRYQAKDFSHRVSSGIPSLDVRLRGGFAAGQLTALGAPSGGGKTSFIVQVCAHAATQGPVLLVSPEMGVDELAERELIRISKCPLWDRNPWTSNSLERDSACYGHSQASIQIRNERLPLHVLDEPDVTMLDVEEEALSIPGLRLVAIDYAQEVASEDDRTPRYMQVGQVAKRSVALARRLNIPVLIASQVNVTQEKGKPKAFTFRETAIIEQKAHNALILDVEWDNEDDEVRKVKRVEFNNGKATGGARIVCTKQRSGTAFRLPVEYVPETYTIRDFTAAFERHTDVGLKELPRA